jgi:hypothetical protein
VQQSSSKPAALCDITSSLCCSCTLEHLRDGRISCSHGRFSFKLTCYLLCAPLLIAYLNLWRSVDRLYITERKRSKCNLCILAAYKQVTCVHALTVSHGAVTHTLRHAHLTYERTMYASLSVSVEKGLSVVDPFAACLAALRCSASTTSTSLKASGSATILSTCERSES